MPSVPREKYPEMNWRAADKVATWKLFKQRMNVIFIADQIPEERQLALILVAGGDEAYNRWDTLEETSARVLIISKLFVVPRLQPRWHRALIEARSHSRTDIVPR